MNTTYTYANTYNFTAGAVTVSGTATGSASGSESSTRMENGEFSGTESGVVLDASYTLTAAGNGSSATTDAGGYVFLDPRAGGLGTYALGETSAYDYTYSEGAAISQGAAGTTVSGSVTLDLTNSAGATVGLAGTSAYNFDGVTANDTYSLAGKFAYATTKFHYASAFTADTAGLASEGDYQLARTYSQNVSYSGKGSYAVAQPNLTASGKYSTDLVAGSSGKSSEGMHVVTTPTSSLAAGGFEYTESGDASVTIEVSGKYTATNETQTETADFSLTQASTATLSRGASGTFWTDGSTSKADGDYHLDNDTTLTIDFTGTVTGTRPGHSYTFSVTQHRDATGKQNQEGKFHIDGSQNTATGTYSIAATDDITSDWTGTNDDTDTAGGTTHHVTGKQSTHQAGSAKTTDDGSYSGDLSDTTWTGTFDTLNKVDTTWKYSGTDDVTAPDGSSKTVFNGDGTNGQSRAADGMYTRTNSTITVTATYDDSDSDTATGHVGVTGTYNRTTPDGWETGEFTSTVDSKSSLTYTDKGSYTLAGGVTTREGDFVRVAAGTTDTADDDTSTYESMSVAGTDAGSLATTSKTHEETDSNDAGHYTDVDGKLTSSGTVVQSRRADESSGWSNTNVNVFAAGRVTSSSKYVGSMTTVGHVTTDSTTKYTRDNTSVTLSGTAEDTTDVTIDWSNTTTGTQTTTGPARTVVDHTAQSDTYHSRNTSTDTYTFAGAGSYAGYTGPTYPGAGTYAAGPQEVTGHADTTETVETTASDHADRNAPDWDDDGSDRWRSGSLDVTSKTSSKTDVQESYDY